MSYYDKADLIYLMSGAAGKGGNGTSKVYSLKGDTDIAYNRGADLGATRIDKDGLIEKGRENLFTHSNEFSNNSSWSKNNLSVSASGDAFDVTDDTSTGSHYLFFSGTTPNSTALTASIEAKAGSVNFLCIRLGGFDYAFFNVSNGQKGTIPAGYVDSKIEATSDGFYRCSVSIVTPASSSAAVFFPANSSSSISYTGTNSVALTVRNAQLEKGLVATNYITSGASTGKAGVLVDEPRFDYSKGEPRLMFEAKKQNLVIFSEFIQSNQGYDASLSFGSLSPQGALNAYRLTATGGNTSHFFISQVVSGLVSGRSYCASIFVKPIAGNSCTHVRFGLADSTATTNVVYSYFDLTGDGAVGSNDEGSNSGTFEFAGIEKLPSGWFRIHLVGNIAVTSLKTVLFLSTDGSNPVAFQDSTAAVDVYGVSIEQFVAADGTANGTKAVTSYIPTYGVAVTRDFDAPMTQNLPSSAQDKYSFFADVTQGEEAASNKAPRLQHSSGSIPANCGYFASGTGNKSFFFDSNAGSGVNRNMSLTKSTSVDNIKYLFVVDNDNLRTKLYVDGSLFADTNMPSGSDVRAMTSRADFDQVRLTASDNGETDFLKTVMTFPTELSHADGEILTGATSFKLYEDMATANNYTVHV